MAVYTNFEKRCLDDGGSYITWLVYAGVFITFCHMGESPGWAEKASLGGAKVTMAAAPRVVTLTEQDGGEQVSIPIGSKIILKLEAVPGTGYGWQIVRSGSPTLQLEGAPVFESKSQAEAGGPEDEVFRFYAREPGKVDLELHYRRPWEKGVIPTRTFTIHVVVE